MALRALVLGLSVLLACGGQAPSTADRLFVSGMLPHHELGMRLLAEATLHSSDVRLRSLVFEMGSYHGREIHQMEQWAADWSVEAATSFPGALGEPDLARLGVLTSLEHDIEWLRLMILHHEGALTLVDDAQAAGSSSAVRALASSIGIAQTRQIEEMRTLLVELCGESPTTVAGCLNEPLDAGGGGDR